MKFAYLVALVAAMPILSCNKGGKTTNDQNKSMISDIELSPPAIKMEDARATPFNGQSIAADSTGKPVLHAGSPLQQADWDKKIIKTANVTLELKDYNTYNQTIHNSTKRYGAYIAAEQQTERDGRLENKLTIKVPVEQFEPMMNALPADGVKVIEKNITTEDVTGEVVDTKARTEAKKQVRDRYLDLLKQAKNMKDILEVQNEINSIQEDIEAGAGRVNYLVHQAAYSTINLTYYQYTTGAALPNDNPTFFNKVIEAFTNGMSIITGFILLMVTFWPMLVVAIVGWWFYKKARANKRVEA